MRDFVTSAFKLGLGAMDLTREQAEELLDRLEKEYGAEIKDGRAMIDEMMKKAEENRKKVQAHAEKAVDEALKRQKLVPEEDLRELAANVEELAKQVAALSKQAAKNAMKAAKKTTAKPAKPTKKAKSAKKAKRR